MVIYYAGWGYECYGDPLQVGDTIEDYFVTEEEDPTWGEEVYYDGHGNLSGDPARSFYVDGKVERIQALVKVEKLPEELLIDLPNTESPLPLDLERKYSERFLTAFLLTITPTAIYALLPSLVHADFKTIAHQSASFRINNAG